MQTTSRSPLYPALSPPLSPHRVSSPPFALTSHPSALCLPSLVLRPLSSPLCPLPLALSPLPSSPCPLPSSSSGFTLVEVLVSLSIMAIALVAVLHAALSIQDAFISTQNKERLAMLAEFKLTQSKILGPKHAVQGQGEFEDHPGYMWEVRVDPTQVHELTEITVTAYPKGEDRETRGITLREYMYAPDRDNAQ